MVDRFLFAPPPSLTPTLFRSFLPTKDLRWGSHCQKIVQKASQTLGLLRRTLSPCKQEVKAKAYQTLIRLQLEYAAETWNPHTLDGVNCLEKIQRASARFVYGDYCRITSVTHLITTLDWDSLHVRRLLFQSAMFYKIHDGLVNIHFPPSIHPSSFIGRHDHQLKYHIPEASVICRFIQVLILPTHCQDMEPTTTSRCVCSSVRNKAFFLCS